ncbi:MAG: chromosome segregation protein SMC, partial [Hyphomonadaceae bacterium]|nr:chromosome segregation protein SMC [Clostridia bacterium]
MYLTGLDIQGFKSFPDKVSLHFCEGITAIVGPNGSGKSNIADAVSWVLGEQSAKSLRGANMQDVIFAGTEKRKSVGYACVSMTLDNSSSILPVAYAEVTVTRKLYRSGESEYFINKTSCRLKDIHELFMDTGLGKDGYSIIGQGRIAEILSNRSEDRRTFFEEATGITKYKFRKIEAERKLEQTRQNMLRITDIIAELEVQIEPLGEQSEKAKQYLLMKEQLKILEINVCLEAIERLKKGMDEVEANYETARTQLTADQETLDAMETRLEQYYELVRKKTVEIETVQNLLHSTDGEIERLKNDIHLIENNKQNAVQLVQKIESEIEAIALKMDSLTFEGEKATQDILAIQQKQASLAEQTTTLETEHATVQATIDALSEGVEHIKQAIATNNSSVTLNREKINSLHALRENITGRHTTVQKEKVERNDAATALAAELQKLARQVTMAKEDTAKHTLRFDMHRESLQNKKNERAMLEAFVQKLTASQKEKQSKRNWLLELEKDFEGYNKSVKNVLREWQDGELANIRLHGVLSQLIHVSEKYVTAVEIALGAAMQNIVVQDEQDAKLAIALLKKKQWGRATFLPVSSVKGNVLDDPRGEIASTLGFVGVGSTLVKCDDKFKGIIDNLLGRTVVVDTIEHGVLMAKRFNYRFRIVTLEGELLNVGGSMTGGSVNKTNSFLSRANEIEQLTQEIETVKASLTEQAKLLDDKTREVGYVESEIAQNEKLLRTYEARIVGLESDYRHLSNSLQELHDAKAQLTQEEEKILLNIDQMAQEAERLATEIEKSEAETQALTVSIDTENVQLRQA